MNDYQAFKHELKLRDKHLQQQKQLFLAVVERQLGLLEYKREDLALRIGMSRATLCKRLANPTSFTISELLHLHRVLRFTEEEKHILVD